jgi:hypothetical protein
MKFDIIASYTRVAHNEETFKLIIDGYDGFLDKGTVVCLRYMFFQFETAVVEHRDNIDQNGKKFMDESKINTLYEDQNTPNTCSQF